MMRPRLYFLLWLIVVSMGPKGVNELPLPGNFSVGVHGAKKRKGKGKLQVFVRRFPHGIWGLLACPPAENKEVSLSAAAYERLPIHPPKHGLPANFANDSWPWLSRLSVLRAPVPCTLVRSCSRKIGRVLDGLAATAHQNASSYDVSLLP